MNLFCIVLIYSYLWLRKLINHDKHDYYRKIFKLREVRHTREYNRTQYIQATDICQLPERRVGT